MAEFQVGDAVRVKPGRGGPWFPEENIFEVTEVREPEHGEGHRLGIANVGGLWTSDRFEPIVKEVAPVDLTEPIDLGPEPTFVDKIEVGDTVEVRIAGVVVDIDETDVQIGGQWYPITDATLTAKKKVLPTAPGSRVKVDDILYILALDGDWYAGGKPVPAAVVDAHDWTQLHP